QMNKSDCEKGLIAASAGNHAQGVALAGKKRNTPTTIYMPSTTPLAKVNATKKYGAKVKRVGQHFDETCGEAYKEQLKRKASFIHPFDDLAIIEGQATVAMEMIQQCPELGAIVVPAGGGGLLAGTALAVKSIRPDIKIIGVQAENVPAIVSAYDGDERNPYTPEPTIAEGISVQNPGKLPLSIIKKYVDEMTTVTESEITSTIMFMLEREKALVEGAAAAAIAAVRNAKIKTKAQ